MLLADAVLVVYVGYLSGNAQSQRVAKLSRVATSGLVGGILIVSLVAAIGWIYQIIPQSEYSKAISVANSLSCILPAGVAERQESSIYKNFMNDNVDKIRSFAARHHKGQWHLAESLQSFVEEQVWQYRDACDSYRQINEGPPPAKNNR